MGKSKNKLITNIHVWTTNHPLLHTVLTLILGALVAWALGWVLPSSPIIASNNPHKELTCILNYSQKLIQKRTSDNRLKIIFDGRETEEPHLYNIIIQNTGNIAVSNEDFKKEFVVEFHGCGGILSAEVSKSSSRYVAEEILSNSKIDGESLVISDFFLNPNESFSLSIITNTASNGIVYNARISDVSTLTLRNTPKEKQDCFHSFMFAILVCMGIVLACIIAECISYKRYNRQPEASLKTHDENIS